MNDKRLAQQLDQVPPDQIPDVLRLASELYAQDRAAVEQAQERRDLLSAAVEAGLPPEYLERAAATLQARRSQPERAPHRRRRPRLMLFAAIGLAWFLLARGFSPTAEPPPPQPAAMPAATTVSAPISPCFQVNLSPYITHRLDESMLTTAGNNLAHLASGLAADGTPYRTFNGVRFRLDGVILVGPGETSNGSGGHVEVRPEVDGIQINRRADQLHFLHGTHWRAHYGQTIASFIVQYTDGSRQAIPIRYGIDVVDWWRKSDRSDQAARPHLVWTGTNDAADSPIRLFMKTWDNPRPDVPIRSLDIVTGTQSPGEGAAAPFLVGLTVEDGPPEPPRSPRPHAP